MRLTGRQLNILILVISTLFPSTLAAQQSGKDQIVGTWNLVTLEYRNSSGEPTYPMGRDAVGEIIYGTDGNFAVQVMRSNRSKFSGNDFLGGTADEKKMAFEGYIAYFGRYSMREGYLIHHVEGSLFPNYVGSNQKRYYQLTGDRLTLTADPFLAGGTQITLYAVWERRSHLEWWLRSLTLRPAHSRGHRFVTRYPKASDPM
jgi:hypothetical protein